MCRIATLSTGFIPINTYRTGGNRKPSKQSMNTDHKSLGTVFSIVICRQPGDKRQSITLFFMILGSTFVDSINFFNCRLSEVFIEYRPTEYVAKTIRNKGYKE